MKLWQIIKDNWTYSLPEHLKYNRYIGVNRVCFQFWCVVYYFIKTMILLLPLLIYFIFYVLYRILKFFFERENYDTQYDEDDEYEDDGYDEYEDNL